jgi:hypothetical protein
MQDHGECAVWAVLRIDENRIPLTAYTINMLYNLTLQRLHKGLQRQTSTGEIYKISKIK